jgi:hypothetical protein
MATIIMKAPSGVTQAFIEGHTYEVGNDGKIKVVSETHVETLRMHGFTDSDAEMTPEEFAEKIEAMDSKEELIQFIEEHGGEADDSMGFKKLKRIARETIAAELED